MLELLKLDPPNSSNAPLTKEKLSLFFFSEVKKSTFVSFYDCYVATATEASSRLDGQPMKVSECFYTCCPIL